MIKKGDNDKKLQDARSYIKKIVILANNFTLPMLYVANDYNRVMSSNVWYVIYRVRKDPLCKYVTLRILSEKADDGN
jgi:hypothetical protein